MSIHDTAKGKYEVRYREGSKNRSRTFERKVDAKRWDDERRRIQSFGGIVPNRVGGETLGDFAMRWLDSKHNLSPATKELYAYLLDVHIEPLLGHLPLTEIRPSTLDEWQRRRLSEHAGRTAMAKAGTLLHQILKRAQQLEKVQHNAAATLERPTSTRRLIIPATPEQIEAMRSYFLSQERVGDATLISVLGYGGLRPGEALALRWDDFEDNRLSVTKSVHDGQLKTTKTEGSRFRDLPAAATFDLRRWQFASMGQALIFPRASDQQPWRKTDWNNWRRRYFAKAAQAAGLQSFRPYDLRHSCASLMIAEGRPVTEVAAQLGHSPALCFSTYAHLIDQARGRDVDAAQWIDKAREAFG